MKVVDIRNVFEDRMIELFEINDSFIYYTEEKMQIDKSNLYILEYNRDTRRERLITNYTLEDSSFVQHLFAFKETIILVLENGSNSIWLVEIDKRSGMELFRKRLVFTGRFYECKALNANNLLITTASDEESMEFFKRYKKITNCDTLAYIYDIDNDKKYFVKCPLISKVGCDGLLPVVTSSDEKLIILDPWGDEETKSYYFNEQRWISIDVRDNIRICDMTVALDELKNGKENLTVRSIASADIKGMIRFAAINDKKLYMKATHFKSGLEKICAYNIEDGTIASAAELPPCEYDNEYYYTEKNSGNTYKLTDNGGSIEVNGMGFKFNASYNSSLGKFVACIEKRFIIAKRGDRDFNIIDTETGIVNEYDCKFTVHGNVLVIY